jgi:tRNA-2-methylthio-N6-dimethylallyladenosine synthase
MAQLRAKEIRQRAPQVDFVVGTGDLSEIPTLVESTLSERKFESRTVLPARTGSVVTVLPKRYFGRASKLKAYVPIQYGCDKFCTFCIVPTTRGRERSRPTVDILDEVKALAENGTKEISLLGQTVNSYGKNLPEGKVPFSELLAQVAAVDGIERVRFTSPYPRDFKADVIQAIRDIPEIMEHVHMPLQAGSDSELKRMRRLYSIESFAEIVSDMRLQIPNISITTDLIVGFPGETEAEFEATIEAVRRFRFDASFMFAYSPRPGTPASDWEDQIPSQLKRERLNELIRVQHAITDEIHAAQVGQEAEILFENSFGKSNGILAGHSREFKLYKVEAPAERIGRIARVKTVKASRSSLVGELV